MICFIFLEFVTILRASLQNFVEKHQFDISLSCFKQILDNYVFNISTCTLLPLSFEICRRFLKKNRQHKLLGFVDQCIFHFLVISTHTHTHTRTISFKQFISFIFQDSPWSRCLQVYVPLRFYCQDQESWSRTSSYFQHHFRWLISCVNTLIQFMVCMAYINIHSI